MTRKPGSRAEHANRFSCRSHWTLMLGAAAILLVADGSRAQTAGSDEAIISDCIGLGDMWSCDARLASVSVKYSWQPMTAQDTYLVTGNSCAENKPAMAGR